MSGTTQNSYTETAEDYLVVTHAVPIERVWPYISEGFELDTIKLSNGDERALISVECLLHKAMQWSDRDKPLDFHQCTYQACVSRNGEPAVYVFATFIESGTPFIMREIGLSNACYADFDLSVSYDCENRLYSSYLCEVMSDEGDTLIELAPETTAPDPEVVRFITGRQTSYFTMKGDILGVQVVEYAGMNPASAKLVDAEFELWEDMGLLSEDEFLSPYSVIIQPSVEIRGSSAKAL